jgi:uncharacterized protein (TIGR02996 family)
MPRYEFSEGSSNKFWEIELEGKAFTTTWGRIGSAGQSTTKTFGSPAQAKQEYDKLVAEKTAKGYQLAGQKGRKAADQDFDDEGDDEGEEEVKKVKKATKVGPARRGGGSAAEGSRYFELVEGTSSKFWEITLEGDSFITRYGRIGTNGQKTIKELGSPDKARHEAEKLIAEKVGKGYVEKGGHGGAGDGGGDDDEEDAPARGGARAGAEARNPELEKAILADPDDEAAYLVYADWLQSQGDPRGELITLSAQAAKTKDRKLKGAADKLFAAHEDHFLGPLAEHRKTLDGKDSQTMTWRWGFVQSLRLAFDHYSNEELKVDLGELLATFLAHPSCRFLTEVVVGLNRQDPDQEYQGIIDALAKRPPPALRSLFIGDFEYPEETEMSWTSLGNFGKLWPKLPELRKLILQGGSFTLGTIDLSELRHAEFRTGGLSRKSIDSIVKARWPKLEHLDVWFGSDSYGAEGDVGAIKPLLDGKGMPALRHLGLKNCEFADDVARLIGKSKILPQLETLDLSLGNMSDVGVEALVSAGKAGFANLKRFDLSSNCITDEGVARLKGLSRGLEADDQRDDGDEDRYAAVGE